MAGTNSLWVQQREQRDQLVNDKRQAILDAAAQLFRTTGYESTLTQLAELLQVTKPTLYHYFSSKEEILLEIKKRAHDKVMEALTTAKREPGAAFDKLYRALYGYAEVLMSDDGMCLAMINRQALELESQKQVEQRVKRAEAVIVSILELGKKDRTLSFETMDITYNTVFGSVTRLAHWYQPDGPHEKAEIARQMVGILMRGLAGPAAKSSAAYALAFAGKPKPAKSAKSAAKRKN